MEQLLPAAYAAPTRRNLAELLVTRDQAVALSKLQEQVLGEPSRPVLFLGGPNSKTAGSNAVPLAAATMKGGPRPLPADGLAAGEQAAAPHVLVGALVRVKCGGAYRIAFVRAAQRGPQAGNPLYLSVEASGGGQPCVRRAWQRSGPSLPPFGLAFLSFQQPTT